MEASVGLIVFGMGLACFCLGRLSCLPEISSLRKSRDNWHSRWVEEAGKNHGWSGECSAASTEPIVTYVTAAPKKLVSEGMTPTIDIQALAERGDPLRADLEAAVSRRMVAEEIFAEDAIMALLGVAASLIGSNPDEEWRRAWSGASTKALEDAVGMVAHLRCGGTIQ